MNANIEDVIIAIKENTPSPESLYNDLGNHWSYEEGGLVEHPVCSLAEVDSFEPSNLAEEHALEFAKIAAEWAVRFHEELNSLLEVRDGVTKLSDKVLTKLNDAKETEKEMGDYPIIGLLEPLVREATRPRLEGAEGAKVSKPPNSGRCSLFEGRSYRKICEGCFEYYLDEATYSGEEWPFQIEELLHGYHGVCETCEIETIGEEEKDW